MADGGDDIQGDIGNDGNNNAVGKGIQQVSIYGDTYSWRRFVQRDLEDLEKITEKLESHMMIGFSLLVLLFFLWLAGTAFIIRQFDLVNLRFDRQIDRIERLVPTPTPFWPGAWPNDEREQ